MKKEILVWFAAACAVISIVAVQALSYQNTFSYLKFEDESIRSVHGIEIELKIPHGFKKTSILNHQPKFHEHPFNVSTAAIYTDDIIIMMHAESVTDHSGFLNYSYLDSIQLAGIGFTTQERCVVISDELLKEARDLGFFQGEGFDFYPAIYMKQFFKTTQDGNYEVVLTYGERVCNCEVMNLDDKFETEFSQRLLQKVNIKYTYTGDYVD